MCEELDVQKEKEALKKYFPAAYADRYEKRRLVIGGKPRAYKAPNWALLRAVAILEDTGLGTADEIRASMTEAEIITSAAQLRKNSGNEPQ